MMPLLPQTLTYRHGNTHCAADGKDSRPRMKRENREENRAQKSKQPSNHKNSVLHTKKIRSLLLLISRKCHKGEAS